MARRTRSAQIENRTARLKLSVRKKPFWQAIAPRIALGYRRNAGSGVWVVRAADGHGGNWTKRFAVADDHEEANGESVLDYWQAQDIARRIARGGEGNGDRPATVAEAVDHYETDLMTRGAAVANAANVRFNIPDTLASKAVALLSARELRTWRYGLIKRGLKPSSTDRVGRSLKAALNLAARDDKRINNNDAWKHGLARLPDGKSARNTILADDLVREIIRTAHETDPPLGVIVEALAETGARESQLLRCLVRDLLDDPPRLMMPSSRKGGRNRKIQRKPLPISPRLASVLRRAATGRDADAPLLVPVKYVSRRFRAVADRLGLGRDVIPYSLRHASIVRILLAGVPLRVVAAHHDTSAAMIEKHYSRYIIGDATDSMVRRTLLNLASPPLAPNVVPIGGRQGREL